MPRKKQQPSGRWLSDDEIREMADSSQREVQIQYLRERGVPFTLSRLGRPLVLVSEIEGRSQPAVSVPTFEPPLHL